MVVNLGLGLTLRVHRQYHCAASLDAYLLHSFIRKRATGRTSRQQALNDMTAQAFASAGIPTTKEHNELSRSDGKWSEGLTMITWQDGKTRHWHVTVSCPLACSYVQTAG